MQQQKQLQIISRGGINVSEIETICELPKVQFLKSTYEIKKIRERKYEPAFKQLLGVVLVKINSLAGIKTEIDDFTKQDIVKMILGTFNELSIEEIYKAFELERYSVYETKTDHFQLFDANYISEILKKYKKWKVEQKKVLNIDAPKEEIQVDKNKIRLDFLKMVYSEIKETGFCLESYLLYDKLESKINATDQQKKELYQQQIKIYEVEEKQYISNRGLQMKTLLLELKERIESKSGVESVKNKCKSILVSEYLKQFVSKSENEFVDMLF